MKAVFVIAWQSSFSGRFHQWDWEIFERDTATQSPALLLDAGTIPISAGTPIEDVRVTVGDTAGVHFDAVAIAGGLRHIAGGSR